MIPLFKVRMEKTAPKAVSQVLTSGFIGQGPVVEQFEDALQNVLGTVVRPITTSSCTAAIQLALMLCGVGPGDEVITTPITCTATNSPIVLAGARPVWADVDSRTGNIDPFDVARKITERTKAVIAVDWSGRPCDYALLRKLVRVPIIQDAAHGPLTPFGGDYVCLSFGAIKHMTSGDGGALIVTGLRFESDEVANEARLLRWYGLDRTSTKSFRCEQNIHRVGTKLHMNDINAAIGLTNLSALQNTVYAHRRNAAIFDAHLRYNPQAIKPVHTSDSSWWLYTMLVEDRPAFVDYMAKHGIEAGQVHARNDKHSGFDFPNGQLFGVDKFDQMQVSIPVGWWLSPDDVGHIIEVVNAWSH